MLDYVSARRRYAEARPESYSARAELMSAYTLVGDYNAARRAGAEAMSLAMAANDPSSTVFQYLHRVDLDKAMEMVEVAIGQANITEGTLYQIHRVLLYAGEVERAARVAQLFASRSTDESSIAMVRVRQACAEDRVADADAIFAEATNLQSGGLIDNQWLFLQTLGLGNEANEAVRYLDEDDGLFALSGFLHYTHFDPRAFPNLQARLEAQGIQRPPPDAIPFACQR